MREIDRHALSLRTLNLTMSPLPVGEERTRLAEESSEELKWLTDQLPELKERFSPFLRFKAWT